MQRDQSCTVTLTAGEWNLVLQALSEMPFRTAAPLIGTIEQQCRAQDIAEGLRQTATQHAPGNGADAEVPHDG